MIKHLFYIKNSKLINVCKCYEVDGSIQYNSHLHNTLYDIEIIDTVEGFNIYCDDNNIDVRSYDINYDIIDIL